MFTEEPSCFRTPLPSVMLIFRYLKKGPKIILIFDNIYICHLR